MNRRVVIDGMNLRIYTKFLLMLTVIALCFIFFIDRPTEPKTSRPKILTWTTWFGKDFRDEIMAECPSKCYVGNREHINIDEADAILFHSQDINYADIPTRRWPHQNYVIVTMESPVHMSDEMEDFPPDFFNTSMSYQLDSDYRQRTYGHFEPISTLTIMRPGYTIIREKQVKAAISKKSMPVLALVSHCSTHSKREAYIQVLATHINLTMVGSCAGGYNRVHMEKCGREFTSCREELIDSHYFLIAFENSVCTDYVTEKFFRMKDLIVPIVLKRSINARIAPNSSFIATDDFESPQKLAEYLKELIKNSEKYARYFDWTREFYRESPPVYGICALCDDLVKERRASTTNHRRPLDHTKFFSEEHCIAGFAAGNLSYLERMKSAWL